LVRALKAVPSYAIPIVHEIKAIAHKNVIIIIKQFVTRTKAKCINVESEARGANNLTTYLYT